MTPPKPPRYRRSYHWHGLRALQTALTVIGEREGNPRATALAHVSRLMGEATDA